MLSDLCRGSWSGLHLQHAEHNLDAQRHWCGSFHEKVKAARIPPELKAQLISTGDFAMLSVAAS